MSTNTRGQGGPFNSREEALAAAMAEIDRIIASEEAAKKEAKKEKP